MADKRIRVSRNLHLAALADAIGWRESLLDTHDPTSGCMTSCCKPGTRCQQYQDDAARLQRYKQARAAIFGPPQSEPQTTTVTLAELSQRLV